MTSGSHTFQISFNMKDKIGEFVDLEKEQADAFILAHEAGHVRNKIPRDGHDQFGFISVMNNGKIHEACFSDTPSYIAPLQPGVAKS